MIKACTDLIQKVWGGEINMGWRKVWKYVKSAPSNYQRKKQERANGGIMFEDGEWIYGNGRPLPRKYWPKR